MSYADDIKTIAKTAILEEKIGKALAQTAAAQAVTNLSIPPERGMTTETGTTLRTDGSVNSPLPDGLVAMKLYDGYIPAVPAQGAANASTQPPGTATGIANGQYTGISSSGQDILTAAQVQAAVAKLNGGSSTDMSNAALSHTIRGGTDMTKLATNAPGDTILSGMVTAATTLGASANDIAQMKANYLSSTYGEPGLLTAKQIGDGNAYNPTLNIVQLSPNSFSDLSLGSEVLRGVVGFDKNQTIDPATNKVKVIKVQLQDNTFPTPTAADAALYGQNTWTDSATPPTQQGYTAGRIWVTIFAGQLRFGSTYKAMCAAIAVATPGTPEYVYTTDGGGGTSLLTNVPAIQGNFHLISGNGNGIVGHTAGSYGGQLQNWDNTGTFCGTGVYSHMLCSDPSIVASSGPACALGPPTETKWPATGVNIIKLIGGVVATSIYDTGVPLSLSSVTSSVVRLAMGNGVEIVDTRFLEIQPAIYGGTLTIIYAADGTTVNSANYYDSNGVLQRANMPAAKVTYYQPR